MNLFLSRLCRKRFVPHVATRATCRWRARQRRRESGWCLVGGPQNLRHTRRYLPSSSCTIHAARYPVSWDAGTLCTGTTDKLLLYWGERFSLSTRDDLAKEGFSSIRVSSRTFGALASHGRCQIAKSHEICISPHRQVSTGSPIVAANTSAGNLNEARTCAYYGAIVFGDRQADPTQRHPYVWLESKKVPT